MIDETIAEIRDMQTHSSSVVAVKATRALSELLERDHATVEEFERDLERNASALKRANPSHASLFNAMQTVLVNVVDRKDSVEESKSLLADVTERVVEDVRQGKSRAARQAAPSFEDGKTFLTHDFSSTVLEAIERAVDDGADLTASDLQTAIVRALTGEIDHDTYRENAVAARDDLAVAAGELAVEGLSEMPAQVQLTDQMGQEQQQALETAATAVQWLDRLVVILPILAVVLVAGVWRLSRSARTTASVTGLALVLSGGPVFVAATLAGSVLEARLPDEPTVTLLLSVIDGFFASLQANALAVLGAGVVLLIAVLVKRYGVDEWTRERLG